MECTQRLGGILEHYRRAASNARHYPCPAEMKLRLRIRVAPEAKLRVRNLVLEDQ